MTTGFFSVLAGPRGDNLGTQIGRHLKVNYCFLDGTSWLQDKYLAMVRVLADGRINEAPAVKGEKRGVHLVAMKYAKRVGWTRMAGRGKAESLTLDRCITSSFRSYMSAICRRPLHTPTHDH